MLDCDENLGAPKRAVRIEAQIFLRSNSEMGFR
jgi:hypothetical protein